MGFFYFDESIQERGRFIVGAFVYSESDLTPAVFGSLAEANLRPGVDEFKSGTRMEARSDLASVRDALKGLFQRVRLGVVILPSTSRNELGNQAVVALEKFVRANQLTAGQHTVWFDSGIEVDLALVGGLNERVECECEFNSDQDSRAVGGIQVADLAAHSLGVMLLERQGLLRKTVKAGQNSGYDPDLDIELGFELWASMRHAFFRGDQPNNSREDDPVGDLVFDVSNCGLYVADSCDDALRTAALDRFGECYLGCIH
jgi:hypothetical protein